VGADLQRDPLRRLPVALGASDHAQAVTPSTTHPFLELRGIRKRFGGVTALRGVHLDVNRGEVVALVGDNGAGKSTLIKTIAGVMRPDSGEFYVDGERALLSSPHAATELGIATVYQDLALCENLDVVANLFLGGELGRRPLFGPLRRLREPEMERQARETLAEHGANVPNLRRPVAGLSGGQRQAVAVGRALLWGSKLVILDEPTAALGVKQTGQVLELIRRLADRGQAVLFISHSLPDVFAVAVRIAVLRLGSNAGTFAVSETSASEIVGAMTGGATLAGAA